MKSYKGIMESDRETQRLDIKTDPKMVEKQAGWAGIRPGMSVIDLGFGSGKTTFCLNKLAQPNGRTVGVDIVEDRVSYAKTHYHDPNIEYYCRDIREPLMDIGLFDFVWVRFVLEYHRSRCRDIIKNITQILKPGGIICLMDLDYNCMTHFGIPERIEKAIRGIIHHLEKEANFDPFVGRKLYCHLFDLGYQNIAVDILPHHLIYGDLNDVNAQNWKEKIEVAAKNSGYDFSEYSGGYEGFKEEFLQAFANPRRFTYTPIILCRGQKPA
jgi:ubiquinone/menaquinone biosynthesis C-methylase UbiE